MEKNAEWIYAPINEPGFEDTFKAVEKALGFKLFRWQKWFIATGKMRCYGRTTAEVLRELLLVDAPPLDFTKRCANRQERFFRDELLMIKIKLDAEGIPTRKIAKTDKELQKYLLEYQTKKDNTPLPPLTPFY